MRRLFFFFFFFTEPSKSTETGLSGRDPFPRAPFSLLLDIGTLAQSPGDLGRGHDALTASPSTLDPGTCGQAQGHAARPRDTRPGPGTLAALGRSGTSEGASERKPQRGGGWLRSALVSCFYSEAPFPSYGSCGCLSLGPPPPPTAGPRMGWPSAVPCVPWEGFRASGWCSVRS